MGVSQSSFFNISHFWKSVRNIGVININDKALRKKVRLTNQIAATNSIITALCIAFFFFTNAPILSELSLLIFFSFIGTFILCYFGFFNLSRFWLAFTSNLAIYFYALLLGRNSGIQYFFIACVGIPIILFELRHKYFILLNLLLSMFLFWAIEFNALNVTPIAREITQGHIYMYVLQFVFALLSCYLVYFSRNNEVFETEIMQARNVASNANLNTKNNSLADILTAQIEELRQSKITLQQEHDLLDLKVKERTEELEKTNESLLQEIRIRQILEEKQEELLSDLNNANQDLRNFAHTVSHDLKAPLRAIKTLIEWVIKDNGDKLDKETNENLLEVSQKASHMRQLIDGILNYSLISKQKEITEDVDLNVVFEEVIFMLSIPNNFSISKDSLPVLNCSRTQMQQVFQNLFTNAIKYNDKPKGIVHVSYTENYFEYEFCVSDNGKGIDSKYFEKIFKLFESLERENNRGAGVGLSIVKQIIDIHGGKVWVTSEVEIGSKFYFSLPKK